MAVSDWLIFGLCFVFVFRVEVKRGRQWDLSKPVWKKMRTASLLLKAQMWWSWMGGSARRHGWQYVKLQPGHLSWMTQQRLCSAAGVYRRWKERNTLTGQPYSLSFCSMCLLSGFSGPGTRRTSFVPGVLVSFTEEHRQGRGGGGQQYKNFRGSILPPRQESSLGIFVYNLE